jgi:hypothetical protein
MQAYMYAHMYQFAKLGLAHFLKCLRRRTPASLRLVRHSAPYPSAPMKPHHFCEGRREGDRKVAFYRYDIICISFAYDGRNASGRREVGNVQKREARMLKKSRQKNVSPGISTGWASRLVPATF